MSFIGMGSMALLGKDKKDMSIRSKALIVYSWTLDLTPNTMAWVIVFDDDSLSL